jgi:two-component system sensor histidine kinase BarA
VIGFTRQMLKTQLSPSQTDYLQTIERSANNLLSIINDILDFSKLEAGKLLLENIPFEFQSALEEVVSLQATSAHEKGLEITLKVDPNIPSGVVGDPLRIQQVLTNLVGNSIKFTERGNIDVSIELRSQEDEQVEIQFMVKDSGIGISERQQAQLFQAFSQADASISRRYGGTGLGLVITQKLVRQMGGEISLTSRLHQGSTFWFTVKLAITDLPTEHIDTYLLANSQLLLVEPNVPAANVLQSTLQQYDVSTQLQSELPAKLDAQDIVVLSLPSNVSIDHQQLEIDIKRAQQVANKVIVGLPSTELALSEKLTQNLNVQCLTKPFTHGKLIAALLKDMTPNQDLRAIDSQSEVSKTNKLPLRIMAVDDNLANLKLISALLDEQVISVTTCSNGKDSVKHAQREHFDIILMDIQMPGMDGVAACTEIKKTSLNQRTPVIAVTAHAMSGERDRLLSAGMDDYLTKPIEEHVLSQVLESWNPYQHAPVNVVSNESTPQVPTQRQDEDKRTNLIIDWQKALIQAANKEDLAKEMLQMLVDYIAEVEVVTQQALNQEVKEEQLLHYIHKLHGSCSYSGVPKLLAVCTELEKQLRSGNNITDIEPELFELQDEMEKVVTNAKHFLS